MKLPEWLIPLSEAFWIQVLLDLREKDEETRLWLDTGAEVGGFLWWCELTKKDTYVWRRRLIALYRR